MSDSAPPAPPLDEHDTLPPSMDPAAEGGTLEPPTSFIGILKKLGPGLIIAGSIVGSGELIATTKTGAQAGISLLWLVIIGCVIKVFVQVELGRFTITHGETTLAALDQVPGPRLGVNWIVWYWFVMMLVSLGQLGGIVGGVGQALAIAFPLTGDYAQAIELPSEKELRGYVGWTANLQDPDSPLRKLPAADYGRMVRGHDNLKTQLDAAGDRGREVQEAVRLLVQSEQREAELAKQIQALSAPAVSAPAVTAPLPAEKQQQLADLQAEHERVAAPIGAEKARITQLLEPRTWDDMYWAIATTLFTVALLYGGSYGLIQNVSTAMVVAFTFITLGNVIALQNTQQWHISAADFLHGLSFSLPESATGLTTALATFGIIGVGASELVAYPYWCLEKGYAKFTGPRSADEAWARRARGWMKVMHYDTWASMLVYTLATLAFYLMGVAVLHTEGRDPEKMRMVSTLSTAYVPVFGEYARWLFLIGALAVLYSTFLVANAGHARTFTDSFKLFGLLSRHNQQSHNRSISVLGVLLPLVCLGIFATRADPVRLVLLGGTMQAIMLPMLAFAALYFRRYMSDPRLKSGLLWDVLLGISSIGLFIAGGWNAYSEIGKLLK